jgi:hypothetical protein
MRNHVFLHLNDKQVSEFRARWKEINKQMAWWISALWI